jgi:UDP-N-acetylglucosamine 1-carboxyvinyltransferase
VFENRLGYTDFLNQMGAQIRLTSACLGETPCRFREKNFVHSAIIQGPTPLQAGKFALTKDIRAAKCLVIAGLVAEGTSEFTNLAELNRKYDHLVPKLQEMGADISLV